MWSLIGIFVVGTVAGIFISSLGSRAKVADLYSENWALTQDKAALEQQVAELRRSPFRKVKT